MRQYSLTAAFALLLKRDLLLAFRHRAEMANPLLFFVLVTSGLIGQGMGPAFVGIFSDALEADLGADALAAPREVRLQPVRPRVLPHEVHVGFRRAPAVDPGDVVERGEPT